VFKVTQVFQLKNRPHGINRGKLFLDEGFVCIGWPGIGDLSNTNRDDIRGRLLETYGYTGQQLGAYTGAVNAFVNTLQNEDVVLVPDGVIVHIGIVGPYYYDPAYDNEEGMCHRRNVLWTATVAKSSLNYKVLEFVRNRGIITKFPGTFEETELDAFLTVDEDNERSPFTLVERSSQKTAGRDSTFDEETLKQARLVLEEALNSTDPEIQIKAAGEILKLSKQ
jgi:predicted Mrr-cat superfamily restriction endonuclease